MTAICVQRFDDSLNSAIRMTYRISLRSSSVREPRYPGHRVVSMFYGWSDKMFSNIKSKLRKKDSKYFKPTILCSIEWQCLIWTVKFTQTRIVYNKVHSLFLKVYHVNDPSAGSPTETLLRLLLPLNEQVWFNSQIIHGEPITIQSLKLTNPFNR